MEPAAIVLVFTILTLLIILGIAILSRSTWRLWQQYHVGSRISTILLNSPIALIGLFITTYATRGIYRLIWES